MQKGASKYSPTSPRGFGLIEYCLEGTHRFIPPTPLARWLSLSWDSSWYPSYGTVDFNGL